MNGLEIAAAASSIVPVTWVEGRFPGLPGEGWFLLNVNPLPPSGEVAQVISDICGNREILVQGGQVQHFQRCSIGEHRLSPDLRKVVNQLQPQSFKVAVHPGIPGRYFGQPLAIAIDPAISYVQYPDHPHLNIGGLDPRVGFEGFVPDSLCYLKNIRELGSEPLTRLKNAFFLITVWLLRHMVWEVLRKSHAKAHWIGPEGARLPPEAYALIRDPLSPCRCGSQVSYFDCHLQSDIQKNCDLSPSNKVRYMRDSVNAKLHWEKSYNAPQQRFVATLKDQLVAQGS